MEDYTFYVPNNHHWRARRKRGLIYWMIFWMLLGVLIGFWLSGGLDPEQLYPSFGGMEESHRPWLAPGPVRLIEPFHRETIIDFKSIT